MYANLNKESNEPTNQCTGTLNTFYMGTQGHQLDHSQCQGSFTSGPLIPIRIKPSPIHLLSETDVNSNESNVKLLNYVSDQLWSQAQRTNIEADPRNSGVRMDKTRVTMNDISDPRILIMNAIKFHGNHLKELTYAESTKVLKGKVTWKGSVEFIRFGSTKLYVSR